MVSIHLICVALLVQGVVVVMSARPGDCHFISVMVMCVALLVLDVVVVMFA